MNILAGKKRISILGCGWLGLALAELLIKKGYSVKGSVTEQAHVKELQNRGIDAFKIAFMPTLNADADLSFFECDVLISCIPPKRQADIAIYYRNQINALIEAVNVGGVTNIIYISSTSVYPNTKTKVTEDELSEPKKESGKALVLAEQLLMTSVLFKTTTLRFGGLIGYDRHPGRFLAGGKNLKNGDVPVNLIHRDDCIAIIEKIIKNEIWQEVFNACCPEHPTRKEFYIYAAQKAGLAEPEFTPGDNEEFKLVDSSKLMHQLPYTFIYNNPLETI